MQLYQRKRHRIMWAVVLIVVPLLAAIAIVKRTTMPTTDPLPVPVQSQSESSQP
jgi:hypothetical protein